MGTVLLELTHGESHRLALLLIGAEGTAMRQEREYRDWALSLPTESQRETARKLADGARAEYIEAMDLRDKLYRAAARSDIGKECMTDEDRTV